MLGNKASGMAKSMGIDSAFSAMDSLTQTDAERRAKEQEQAELRRKPQQARRWRCLARMQPIANLAAAREQLSQPVHVCERAVHVRHQQHPQLLVVCPPVVEGGHHLVLPCGALAIGQPMRGSGELRAAAQPTSRGARSP
jgi:hypothetical protein